MSDTIIAQVPTTRLDWRIASESPSFDLDADLWVCTASDGTPIYAPRESECNRERRNYEYHLLFRVFAKTAPGSTEQRHALDAMRQMQPRTWWFDDNADLINESIMHGREHTA
jgi:hypothetical protein